MNHSVRRQLAMSSSVQHGAITWQSCYVVWLVIVHIFWHSDHLHACCTLSCLEWNLLAGIASCTVRCLRRPGEQQLQSQHSLFILEWSWIGGGLSWLGATVLHLMLFYTHSIGCDKLNYSSASYGGVSHGAHTNHAHYVICPCEYLLDDCGGAIPFWRSRITPW